MNSSTEKNAEQSKTSGFRQDLEYLRQIPIFQNLDFECLKLLAMLSKKIELINGDQLIIQGEDDGFAYYLIQGKLNSYYKKNDTVYPVQSHDPGQFIGGMGLFGKSLRLFTVEAVEKSTVLRLNREGFKKVMLQFPNTMTQISANLSAELVRWEQNLLNSIDDENLEQAMHTMGISLI